MDGIAGLKDAFGKLKDATTKASGNIRKIAKHFQFARRYGMKPSALTEAFGLVCPPEVDAVEQLAAISDPEIKKRVAYKQLAREIWLEEDENRKRMQAETVRAYAALDVKATLSLYENYADMDKYPEIQLPYYAHDAERVE